MAFESGTAQRLAVRTDSPAGELAETHRPGAPAGLPNYLTRQFQAYQQVARPTPAPADPPSSAPATPAEGPAPAPASSAPTTAPATPATAASGEPGEPGTLASEPGAGPADPSAAGAAAPGATGATPDGSPAPGGDPAQPAPDQERPTPVAVAGQAGQPGADPGRADASAPVAEPPADGGTPTQVQTLLEAAGIVPAPMARLGGTRIPAVGEPPALPPQNAKEIHQRSGIRPDEHHDRIRMMVRRIERDLSRFQVASVRMVEQQADAARLELTALAETLPGVTAGAVGAVRRAANTARTSVRDAARDANAAIELAGMQSTEEVDGHAETTVENALAAMNDSTGELRTLYDTKLKPAYQRKARQHGAAIEGYPVEQLATSAIPMTSAIERMSPSAPEKAQQIATAYQAETEGDPLLLYKHEQRSYELPDLGRQMQRDLQAGARTRAGDLLSTQMEGQFTLFFLQLVDPTAVYIRQETNTQSSGARETARVVEFRIASGRERATRTVELLQEAALAQLDAVERQVVGSIQDAGRKAHEAALAQAQAVENGIREAGAPFADAYRKQARRVAGMVPRGRFLDLRQLGPALKTEEQAGRKLREGQEVLVDKQRRSGQQAAEEAVGEQRKGLQRASAGGVRSAQAIENPAVTDIEAVKLELEARADGAARGTGAAAETVARGIGRRFGRAPADVETQARQVLDTTIEQNFASVVSAFKTNTNSRRDSLDESVAGSNRVYLPIDNAAAELVKDRSNAVNNACEHRTWGIFGGTDEDGLFRALNGLSDKGLDAVDQHFRNNHHRGGIRARVLSELEDEAQHKAASALLDTAFMRTGRSGANDQATRDLQRATYAAELSRDSLRWFGVAHDVREGALRALSPAERAQLTNVPGWSGTLASLRSDLRGANLGVTEALIAGNPERAFAIRFNERMGAAIRSGNNDQAVDLLSSLSSQIEADLRQVHRRARISPSELRRFEDRMFREHAVVAGQRTEAQLRTLDDTTARRLFVEHGSRVEQVYVSDGEGQGHYENRQLSADARGYLQARVTRDTEFEREGRGHDESSPRVRAALLAYETRRAEQEGGRMSEFRRERVIRAGEDTELFQARRALREAEAWQGPARERQARIDQARTALTEAERRNTAFLSDASRRLGADRDTQGNPARAREFMAARMENLFSPHGQWGRRTGRSMIEQGRTDILAATMLATEGGGTHEQGLEANLAGRSREEIEELRRRYASEVAGRPDDLNALDRMLGTGEAGRRASWTELSGDDRQRVEILLLGEVRTDQDRARVAALRARHARENGVDGERSMQGTTEDISLRRSQRELEEFIVAAAKAHGGSGPAFVNGEPNPAAFDRDGNFLGTRPPQPAGAEPTPGSYDTSFQRFHDLAIVLEGNAEAYRAELERKEAFVVGIIQAIGAIAAAVALFIPGLNLLAAATLAAVIAATTGLATMAAKQAMRGSRYGWEEALGDLGMTVVDTALAFTGARFLTTARIGGSAAIREGLKRGIITGGLGSMARTAMADQTWHRGGMAGLGNVFRDGVKGAVVSGVTEALGARMGGVGEASRQVARGSGRLVTRVGAYGRVALAEGATNALAAVTGEAAGMGFDALTGRFHGTFGDALQQLAFTGAREFLGGSIRGVGNVRLDRRRMELQRQLATQDHPPTPRQLEQLYRYARSSNDADQFREGPDGQRTWYGREQVIADLMARRQLLGGIPPAQRQVFAGMELDHLRSLRHMLDTGDLGTPHQRLALAQAALHVDPRLDLGTFTRALQQAHEGATQARAREAAVRMRIAAELPRGLRAHLDRIPVAELERLPPEGLRRVAELVARGEHGTPRERAELLRMARAADPTVDAGSFLQALGQVVAAGRQAREVQAATRRAARQQALADVPPTARRAFADLPDGGIHLLKRVLASDEGATPGQAEALLRMARASGAEVDGPAFHAALSQAATAARDRRNAVRRAERQGRHLLLAELPAPIRGPLTALPADAIPALRAAIGQGEVSPQVRESLLARARQATPGLDEAGFVRALDQAVAHARSAPRSRSDLVGPLLAGVPAGARDALRDTPIHVLDARSFEAATGSRTAQAVTLIVDGRPRVVVKEGADPAVLREEGLHLLQAREPGWRGRIGALDEGRLQGWARLPLAEQLALYRNKLEIEIDAQARLAAGLRAEAGGGEPVLAERARLAEVALANLRRRLGEVEGIGPREQRDIARGARPRPDWLEQPARLFHKAPPEPEPLSPVQERIDGQLVRRRTPAEQADYEGLVRSLRQQQAEATREAIELQIGARKTPDQEAEYHLLLEHMREVQAAADSPVARRVNETLGLDPDSPHRAAMDDLASWYRQQEATGAAETHTVSGRYTDQMVDLATGLRMTDAAGNPWGYGGSYGFDIRFMDHGVAQITMRVHLDPQAGVSAADVAAVQARAAAGIDRFYNDPNHRVTGPDGKRMRLRVEVEFVAAPADAHLSVKLHPGQDRADQRNWFVDNHETVLAHELTHQLGLRDEYADSPYAIPGSSTYLSAARIGAFSPHTYGDRSLMGNFWVRNPAGGPDIPHPATAVKRRHINHIMRLAYRQMGQPVPWRHRALPRLTMPLRWLRMQGAIAWLRVRARIRTARGLPPSLAPPPMPPGAQGPAARAPGPALSTDHATRLAEVLSGVDPAHPVRAEVEAYLRDLHPNSRRGQLAQLDAVLQASPTHGPELLRVVLGQAEARVGLEALAQVAGAQGAAPLLAALAGRPDAGAMVLDLARLVRTSVLGAELPRLATVADLPGTIRALVAVQDAVGGSSRATAFAADLATHLLRLESTDPGSGTRFVRELAPLLARQGLPSRRPAELQALVLTLVGSASPDLALQAIRRLARLDDLKPSLLSRLADPRPPVPGDYIARLVDVVADRPGLQGRTLDDIFSILHYARVVGGAPQADPDLPFRRGAAAFMDELDQLHAFADPMGRSLRVPDDLFAGLLRRYADQSRNRQEEGAHEQHLQGVDAPRRGLSASFTDLAALNVLLRTLRNAVPDHVTYDFLRGAVQADNFRATLEGIFAIVADHRLSPRVVAALAARAATGAFDPIDGARALRVGFPTDIFSMLALDPNTRWNALFRSADREYATGSSTQRGVAGEIVGRFMAEAGEFGTAQVEAQVRVRGAGSTDERRPDLLLVHPDGSLRFMEVKAWSEGFWREVLSTWRMVHVEGRPRADVELDPRRAEHLRELERIIDQLNQSARPAEYEITAGGRPSGWLPVGSTPVHPPILLVGSDFKNLNPYLREAFQHFVSQFPPGAQLRVLNEGYVRAIVAALNILGEEPAP